MLHKQFLRLHMNLVAHFSLSVLQINRLPNKTSQYFFFHVRLLLFPPFWPLTKYTLHQSAVTNVVLCHSWTDPIHFFFFWSSHKVVRVNDLTFFFYPSPANWLLQGGLNRPARLYHHARPLLVPAIGVGNKSEWGMVRWPWATGRICSLPSRPCWDSGEKRTGP